MHDRWSWKHPSLFWQSFDFSSASSSNSNNMHHWQLQTHRVYLIRCPGFKNNGKYYEMCETMMKSVSNKMRNNKSAPVRNHPQNHQQISDFWNQIQERLNPKCTFQMYIVSYVCRFGIRLNTFVYSIWNYSVVFVEYTIVHVCTLRVWERERLRERENELSTPKHWNCRLYKWFSRISNVNGESNEFHEKLRKMNAYVCFDTIELDCKYARSIGQNDNWQHCHP